MKNKRRFLLALAFTIPTTFIFKGGETNYASKQLGEYNNAINANDSLIVTKSNTDGKYVKLPRRTINQRGLDRNPVGETYTSKFNEADLPYEGHPLVGDKTTFDSEVKEVLTSSKTKLLTEGKTTYYAGAEKIYSKDGISKDAKAVDSTLSFPLDGFTYSMGLFAVPGEVVNLYVPVEFKNELFNNDLEKTISFVIGTTGRNYSDTNRIEDLSNDNQVFSYRRTIFTSNEIFDESNTAVIDGKLYYAGKIASPLGGPIYVQSNFIKDYNISIRATGALESRYYALDVMSDEENLDNYNNFTAPYFDVQTPSMRFSGEYNSREDLNPTNIFNFAYFFQQRQNITSYLNHTYVRQVVLVDRYTSDVQNFGRSGENYVIYRKNNFDFDISNYLIKETELNKVGTTSSIFNLNSRNHLIKGSYVNWGLDLYSTSWDSVWAINGIQNALISNIAAQRVDADNPLANNGSSYAWLADPYSTMLGNLNKRKSMGANSNISAYAYNSIFHSIGLGVMREMDNFAWNASTTNKPGQATNKITNGDITLRGLTYYSGFDFSNYMEKTLGATISQTVKDEIRNKVCSDTSTTCVYPTFASTASLYTKSNERVHDLEQWRKDIEANVKQNGIPSYFSDSEAIDSLTRTADYNQSSEYVLKDGTATQEGIDKNVYKRNYTGANFRIDDTATSTLNLKSTYNSSTGKFDGRIASSEDIKKVTLEWQQNNGNNDAITDNGDQTFTVDPSKITTEDGTYNFAVSVEYTESTIPTEILYGTLEKGLGTKDSDKKLRASPVLANTYYASSNNIVDQKLNDSQLGLISYGYYQKDHIVSGDDQDTQAFKNEYFTKFNAYDPNITDTNKKVLTDAERILSDGMYLTGTNSVPALDYLDMETNYGALYYTYENVKGLNIGQIILRDLQNYEANYTDWQPSVNTNSDIDKFYKGTIGDVSIYVGDMLDENGSPDLSNYKKITTKINQETWDVNDGGVYNYHDRKFASNRVINFDDSINNKYIVVKIENGQTATGGKDGSFRLAEIEFHSYKSLGTTYTDTSLENTNIKTFGNWNSSLDLSVSKQKTLNGSKGDYLGFGFEGSMLSINANQFEGSGKIRVNIDSQSFDVDTNNSTGIKDNSVFYIDLENKEHLVTIEVLEGNVELTSISFNNDKFIEVTEKQIKDQLGIKDDSNTDTDKPSEPEDPTDPDNPTTDITTNNKMTNIIIGSVGYSLLGIAVISLGAILIVEHKKNKQKVDQ